jgi:hypothetical protein
MMIGREHVMTTNTMTAFDEKTERWKKPESESRSIIIENFVHS